MFSRLFLICPHVPANASVCEAKTGKLQSKIKKEGHAALFFGYFSTCSFVNDVRLKS